VRFLSRDLFSVSWEALLLQTALSIHCCRVSMSGKAELLISALSWLTVFGLIAAIIADAIH
jgi:ABC-type antimicrobial peptide transport system permease subunit